jgi:putative transposase
VTLRRPSRLKTFDYIGKHCYFVTCSTEGRQKVFIDPTVIVSQTHEFERTCAERQFAVLAYVYMEDHFHTLLEGASETAAFVPTMKLIRQRMAIDYARQCRARLWQRGYYERVLRPSDNRFEVVRYIAENPARGGLPPHRSKYPYLWIAECLTVTVTPH